MLLKFHKFEESIFIPFSQFIFGQYTTLEPTCHATRPVRDVVAINCATVDEDISLKTFLCSTRVSAPFPLLQSLTCQLVTCYGAFLPAVLVATGSLEKERCHGCRRRPVVSGNKDHFLDQQLILDSHGVGWLVFPICPRDTRSMTLALDGFARVAGRNKLWYIS